LRIRNIFAASIIAAGTFSLAVAANSANLIDTAVDTGQFKALVVTVQAAGLGDALSGPGSFTVFAPTDKAFSKLPAGTVEYLLKPENREKLVAILTYHVISGKVMAADITSKKLNVKTLQGSDLVVDAMASGVSVNGAKVTAVDIEA
jgi:uncharacterized surface protein with fasciclin (FAS1) repeats